MLKNVLLRLEKPSHWIWVLALVAIPLILFGKAQSFDFINLDDDRYVYDNRDIRSFSQQNFIKWFSQPYVSLYVPLPMLSYAIDYQLYKNDPSGYHRTNILIHVGNVLLVYFLFSAFFPRKFTCFLGALLFAIHPAQTESVAWISERKNLLFCFFALTGLIWFIHSHRRGKSRVPAGILWVSAGLSKINAVIIPFLVFALSFFEPRFKINMKKTMFLVLFLTAAGATFAAFLLYPQTFELFQKENFWRTLISQIPVTGLYLSHFVAPLSLGIFYDHDTSHFSSTAQWLSASIATSCLWISMAWAIFRRRFWGFWLFWFLISLLPMTSFFPILVNDRHLYFASIGLIGCILSLANQKTHLSVCILIFYILFSFVATPSQVSIWKDNESLWKQTLTRLPRHDRAMTQLAHSYLSKGNNASAEKFYLEALSVKPVSIKYHLNLGHLYLKTGQIEKAENLTAQMEEKFPRHAAITTLKSGIALAAGENQKALELAREAIQKKYHNPIIYRYLGLANLNLMNFQEARINFQKASDLGDNSFENQIQTAIAWGGAGQWQEMLNLLSNLERNQYFFPGIFFQMGYAYLKLGDKLSAQSYYKKSIQLQPSTHEAYDHLGLLALEDGQNKEAYDYFQSALEYSPGSLLYQKHLQTVEPLKEEADL